MAPEGSLVEGHPAGRSVPLLHVCSALLYQHAHQVCMAVPCRQLHRNTINSYPCCHNNPSSHNTRQSRVTPSPSNHPPQWQPIVIIDHHCQHPPPTHPHSHHSLLSFNEAFLGGRGVLFSTFSSILREICVVVDQ